MAGMWAFKARDTVAAALLSMRGSYWIGFGILFTLDAAGVLPIPEGAFPAFGYWFITLGAITAVRAVAATKSNKALLVILGTVALGCGCFSIGLLVGSDPWKVVAAYLFIIGALAAFYTASVMMLDSVGLQILPIGQAQEEKEKAWINAGIGEPGVQQGQ